METSMVDILESHDHGASSGRVNFLLLVYLGSKGYKLYSTLNYDDDDELSEIIRFRELRLNPSNPYYSKDYYVVGSCNGLICMAMDIESDNSDEACGQPIYITNPTTKEWLTVPTSIFNRNCDCLMNDRDSKNHACNCNIVVCGFGYLPSTNEYKVVRIYYYYYQQRRSRVGRVQVYTLGDGNGWRDKGEIPYTLQHNTPLPSVLANGALHWLDEAGVNVVAFDLADEEFSLIPSPSSCFLLDSEMEYWTFQIKVLGGKLCAVFHKDNFTVCVWVLKNEGKNGNYDQDGNNGHGKYQFWSWVKELDIETDDLMAGHLTPFILTKQGDVLSYGGRSLFCHELKTATLKELVDMRKCFPDFLDLVSIIPHLNSSISLKDLGEEDIEIIIESPNQLAS